jgi:hypothetical protein
MDKKPTKLIPLLIYFLKIVLTKKLGPIWLRVLVAILLGLLLALQVVCGGFFPT